jgi:hypothetical protein
MSDSPAETEEEEKLYEVERIDDCRTNSKGVKEYLVKWDGYKRRNWEPEANLAGAPLKIKEYELRQRSRSKGPKPRPASPPPRRARAPDSDAPDSPPESDARP